MTPKEFFDTVAKMRDAQKAFFGNPRGTKERMEAYSSSRFLEAIIDAEILRVKGILTNNEKKKQDDRINETAERIDKA